LNPGTIGTFTDLRIAAEGTGAGAVPPLRWRPGEDLAFALRIEHTPGQPLSPEWVRRQFVVNGLSAAGMSIDRSLALVQLINRAFLTAGFVNSGVVVSPQTSLATGFLGLRLIHGRLTAPDAGSAPVTVEWQGGGSRGLTADYIRHRLPSAGDLPLNATPIERDFRLLAQDPAIRTVSADLRPGSRPGEASLHLVIVPEDPFDVYITAANSRSPSVGGERAAFGAFLRNLAAAGDILSGEVGATEGLTDAAIGYVTPFFNRRTFLSLRGSLNNAAVVDQPLIPLDIKSRDRAVEIGITHRLIDQPLTPAEAGGWFPAQSLSVGFLVAHRESRSFLLGEPFSFSPGSVNGQSEYTAVRLVTDGVRRSTEQVIALSITATVGIDGTRSDVVGIANPEKRFKSLLLSFNYARRLKANGLEFRGRLLGQLASSVLYSGERLAVGGENTVRGYRENVLLADQGIVGSVELAQPFSLTGSRRSATGFNYGAFSVAGFADAAAVSNVDGAAVGQRKLFSIGAALSWTPSEAVFARVSYALALKDIQQTGSRDLQDRGFHFRLTAYPLQLFRR